MSCFSVFIFNFSCLFSNFSSFSLFFSSSRLRRSYSFYYLRKSRSSSFSRSCCSFNKRASSFFFNFSSRWRRSYSSLASFSACFCCSLSNRCCSRRSFSRATSSLTGSILSLCKSWSSFCCSGVSSFIHSVVQWYAEQGSSPFLTFSVFSLTNFSIYFFGQSENLAYISSN